MKKAFSILVLCGIIMLMISCTKKGEISPIDSVTNEEEYDLDDSLGTESLEEDDKSKTEEKDDQKTYSYTYPGASSPTEVTVAFLGRGVTKTKWEKAKPKMMKEFSNYMNSVLLASMVADFKEIELLYKQERWFIRKALSEYNLSDSEIYYIYFSINNAVSFIMVRIENNCKSYQWFGLRGYINPFKILNRLK
ncbi:MAG: hypothetical protein ACTTJ6_08420 [Treponema sp.]